MEHISIDYNLIHLVTVSLFIMFLSALCSLSEISIVAITKYKIDKIRKEKPKTAKQLERIQKEKTKYLSSIIALNTIINIAGSAWIGALSMSYFSSTGHVNFIALLSLTMLLFSEMKPKLFAQENTELTARATLYFIKFFGWFLTPVVNSINGFLNNKQSDETIEISEIEHHIETALELGVLSKKQGSLIKNTVNIRDLTAEDILSSKKDATITSINISANLEDYIKTAKESKHYQIVITNSDGEPLGSISKDQIFLMSIENKNNITSIIKHAPSITKSALLTDITSELFQASSQLAVIKDDSNKIAGVVTFHDINSLLFNIN